ncbi:MAG: hypothetical protein KDC34_00565 [Saprospiraceae bacterium]|nr:hypothetical protein [Saprospiraceae bacterium]
MRIAIPFLLLLCFGLSSCKKETIVNKETVVDNYIYGINNEEVYQSNVEKTKQKSAEQYISILYANLFLQTVPANVLTQLTEVREANGDKQLVDELILNNYVNSGQVNIPSDSEMRANIDQFIEDTYLRFFLRKPTPYELYELRQAIEEDSELNPELIYQGFALSNEYKYY